MEIFFWNRFRFPLLVTVFCLFTHLGFGQSPDSKASNFSWPEGKRAAVSLSFDDARLSQIDVGLPLFKKLDVQATFYVVPSNVEKRLSGWKEAVAAGQEIGNHSVNHPCTGNFSWSRESALENYTLEQMTSELKQANRQLEDLLGIKPSHFAYPCGHTFVDRGEQTKSYVPIVAELFVSGRRWLDEGPNDPAFVDLAQVTGMPMDEKSFAEIKPLLKQIQKRGQWLVLAGHEIGEAESKTTRVAMLKQLIQFVRDPANDLWLAPVGTVANYIHEQRQSKE